MIKSVMVDGVEAVKLMVDGTVAWERGGHIDGYQRCKYLQSDGKQYISIVDYTPEIGDSISVNFIEMSINNGAIFSAGTGEYQLIALSYRTNNYLYFKYFTTGSASSLFIYPVAGEQFILSFFGDGTFKLNDIVLNTEVQKHKEPVNTNMYLFIRANLEQGFSGRILAFSAERNGEAIVNLVPTLRSSDGKPGMLDTVSGNFYTNQGTGEFLYELE